MSRVYRGGRSVHLRKAEKDWVGQIQGILTGRHLRRCIVSIRRVRNLCENRNSGRRLNSTTADETHQVRDLTASAEAESTLRRVKESPNAYPPLKSVADDLCFILNNCEV